MRPCFLLAVAMVGCFLSCQKEPDANLLGPTACKLNQIVYYEKDVAIDTAGYEYTGDRVSKVNYSDYYTELEYAGNKILKKNYYEEGTATLFAFDDFMYNADSTIARVDFYLVDASLPQPFLFFQYNFSYTAGKLEHSEVLADTTGTGPELLYEYSYQYTGDNITQVIENDLEEQAADTVQYTYDTKQNYYSKNPNLWLNDNFFSDFYGIVLPFALSANNVITIGSGPGINSAVTYEETDKEEIETLSIGGELWVRYKYKCQ